MNKTVTSREEILSAARSLATEQGIAALGIRQVAALCGVSVGSIYNYFPAKSDLVIAVVEEIWRQVFHPRLCTLASCSGFPETVAALFEAAKTAEGAPPQFFAQHASLVGSTDRIKARGVMEEYFGHIRTALSAGLAADPAVRREVFGEDLSEAAFVQFVFSSLLVSLGRGDADCDTLLAVIRRVLY